MSKPTVYISTRATDLTNQANVAAKLFDHVSHQAGQEVWNADPGEWMVAARKYVNLESWDLYGTRWEPPAETLPMTPLSPLTDYSPVPSADHHSLFPTAQPVSEAGNALTKIKRFLGFRNGA